MFITQVVSDLEMHDCALQKETHYKNLCTAKIENLTRINFEIDTTNFQANSRIVAIAKQICCVKIQISSPL